MMKEQLRWCYVLAVLLSPLILLSQPANDECANAIELTNLVDWCSANGAFNNTNATLSTAANPACFPQDNFADVWFSFVARATDLNVSIAGARGQLPGGTLRNPELAIYSGACGNLTEIQCFSDAFGNNVAETFVSNLQIGQRYYIRVAARSGRQGTFRICINNFNQVPDPSSDCDNAVLLCDKSSFTVRKVQGAGRVNDVDPNSCLNNEFSSTWYKWTAQTNGTLTFTLTPLNPSDDLDFGVYELTGGINSCRGKRLLRCMASGENVGQPFSNWQRCSGSTGLREGSADFTEQPGCQTGDDNFVAPLIMEAGKSYALMVMNFSESGNGFSISFGGTGTFVGPQAAFTVNDPDKTFCIDQAVSFTNASTFTAGRIVQYNWNFGANAGPATATGAGPHNIQYGFPGKKTVVLTIESEGGCIVTHVDSIFVECCGSPSTVSANISNVLCTEDRNGTIDLSVQNPFSPLQYLWDNGQQTQDIGSLGPGTYQVTITDALTCDTTLSFEVTAPPPIVVDTVMAMPTCGGGMDGSITLPTSGGSPPYNYNWQGRGFNGDNFLRNIGKGDYQVVVRDNNNCTNTLLIPLRELQLILDPTVTDPVPPTCFGDADAAIQIRIANGLGPFQYDWMDGRGFVDESSLNGITAGTYQVRVLDINLCEGNFDFQIRGPDPVEVIIERDHISCNGVDDGALEAAASGGVGNYSYRWSNNSATALISNLPPGLYTVTASDGNGCIVSDTATIIEPAPIFVNLGDILDVLCNGDATGSIQVVGSGGVAPYTFSKDGTVFQPDPFFDGLPAGAYTLFIRDAEGCTSTVSGLVNEPPPLLVDAGDVLRIELGNDTIINTVVSPGTALVTYEWSPADSLSCLDCPDPRAFPANTVRYTVKVTDPSGCMATDDVIVEVIKVRPIYIPNAFSPNQDGYNNNFIVYGRERVVKQVKSLRIFSRWGELIYEGFNLTLNDEEGGWDGTFKGQLMQPAVFAFVAEVEFIDNEVYIYKGDVTLMR